MMVVSGMFDPEGDDEDVKGTGEWTGVNKSGYYIMLIFRQKIRKGGFVNAAVGWSTVGWPRVHYTSDVQCKRIVAQQYIR